LNPIVSIIVACYNKEVLIKETIDSVINQSYQHWELLIIDDCSTDNSITMVKNYLSDVRITLIENEANKGANFCRNKGIELSKGEYILFLDADDLLIPKCIEGRVKVALENSDSNLCVFTMGVFYKSIGDDHRKWEPKSKNPLKDFLKHKLPWSILQPLWKRELLISLNGFDETFSRLQDVELSTRALLNKKIKYTLIVSEPDCFYRIDEDRKSFNTNVFLEKWIDSAVRYYCKFFDEAKTLKLERLLMGTIYQTYLQILHSKKFRKIDESQYEKLKVKLLHFQNLNLSGVKARIFDLSEWFNLMPIRIPGINWVLSRILNIC